jgi:diaminopimelate epimerase
MARPLVVEFTKMHGAGNDFIVIDNRFFHFSDAELSTLARTWCPRRTGIGADGILALAQPVEEVHDYRMRYVNADGSLAQMCGNGARCLARFARDAGLKGNPLTFESDAGLYRVDVPADPEAPVQLHVPPPRDFRPDTALETTSAAGQPVHYVWTGTEHVVSFVPDVEAVDVHEVGRAIRQDAALAPAGANANFVQVIPASNGDEEPVLRVRTFEKGVEAETQACGTGALAAAVVAHLQGHVEGNAVAVAMPGGTLRVGFMTEDGVIQNLYLEGPAVKVFRGTMDVDPQTLSA